ncbi:MAG: bifunctional UDP-3-O-[3-hydroxymyristoyl] N-acetylglucosamine deacetylase/3-hydroxyacyl-ACP dehydratase [Bacteroidetes bacterium]|nr:bifunctional UDP-3-O-[3-hydroxymyristoyl] N-acetylglucosamine deacetylase/3-hydroxyacyl-ACP dehydratase [Bacteroidota bacterium]
MSEKQKTLAGAVSFEGKGLHTGLMVKMTINPADDNFGIRFRRTDLESTPIVRALAEFVTSTSRGTTIEQGDAKVSTIEHLMYSLYTCDIDNALIDINAPEVPILDGSAKDYVAKFSDMGVVDQKADRKFYEINNKCKYQIEGTKTEITGYADDEFTIDLNVDFNSSVIGKQYAMLHPNVDSKKEIAPCRTFVFLHEISPLIEAGLIKGGDVDNAIVIVEKPISEEERQRIAKVFGKEDIEVTNKGYLNHLELRHENEIARHKLIDLIGDLFLTGVRLKGKVFAKCPGHHANTEFAKIIRKHIKEDSTKCPYKYDINTEPLYDINRIKATLPHRPPFLLVDKIMEMTEDSIVGVKNITMNEPFFVGHFPDEPVMPGVLQVEAMAQCGGILALSTVDEPEKYSTYFMKIDEVKFKNKVVPGDTLIFVLKLVCPIRRGIVKMAAQAFIGNKLASEAILMAQIVKNK